ncbi:MAG TPA: glucosamine-6-phosphate deaminase [Sphingobacterium sp.]|nr:glucosamine-6-phosphate deaminase [Sphingobacterium sp.]
MQIKSKQVDNLQVKEYETRKEMGIDAARMASLKIQELQKAQGYVRVIFASAPSQNEFLEGLIKDPKIDWSRLEIFHMDEYIGLPTEHPQSFATFLREKLFDKAEVSNFHYIKGDAEDIEQECRRYADLLKEKPIDIVFMGIGENTHIAFNEPHIADFDDPLLVKIVDLDEKSRQQQVNDGCFLTFGEVPSHAVTLTIPALISARYLYCMVPGATKQEAVYKTLKEPINSKFPSTILRQHKNAILYLDKESAKTVKKCDI